MRCFFVCLVGVGGCDSSEGGLALLLLCLTKRVCVTESKLRHPKKILFAAAAKTEEVCEQSMAGSADFVVFPPSAFFPRGSRHDGNADSLQQQTMLLTHAISLIESKETVLKNTLKRE